MDKPKHTNQILQLSSLSFFFLLFFVLIATAQTLPPAKSDGFVYGNWTPSSDPIIIEAFYDPVCPDSRDSWYPLKEALDFYGSRVWLVVHLLPLPYHDNAFAASRALHIVDLVNTSATFPLLEGFFKNQTQFYNAPTRNLSRVSVVEKIVNFAVDVLGDSYHDALVSGFNDTKTDLRTRVSFKFSTSRGIYGTPFFFINGFRVNDNDSGISFAGWKSYIDPLLGKSKSWEPTHLLL